jgi:hypothetical protein
MQRLPFFNCGLPPFQAGGPFATVSLCRGKGGGTLKFSPLPFSLRRLPFSPGDKQTGPNGRLVLETIQNDFPPGEREGVKPKGDKKIPPAPL